MARRPTKKRAVDPGDERSHRDVSDEVFALASDIPGGGNVPIAPGLSLSAVERVAAGASWLDRVKPGWWLLCPEDVSIMEREKDPLYLAFGAGPWSTTDALRLIMDSREVQKKDRWTGALVKTWIPRHPERIYSYGFFPDPVAIPTPPYRFDYVELDDCWRREVARRKGCR